MEQAVKIGLIGCGNVSHAYLPTIQAFDILHLAACADLDRARARAAADASGARACSVEDLLSDPEIEIVVNLTTPGAHAEVAMAAVRAGKHVYNEKPITITREQARAVLETAQTAGVLVGAAPDTFMGAGLQTCRQLLDEGAIGRPTSAVGFIMFHGHEHWHPDPAFYYQAGGGPMFDMGVYHVTALVGLLGAARRVTGATNKAYDRRTVGSEPMREQTINVDVATHVAGLLDFENGAVGNLITSFDTWGAEVPSLQIFGTEGTLSAPDPNSFGGPIRLWRAETGKWQDVALTHGYAGQSRGLGVADMAYALRSGRFHRASGGLAYHVLDIMQAIHEAAERGHHIELTSQVDRPAPLPTGLEHGQLDP